MYRPIGNKLNSVIRQRNSSFRRRYNITKADWLYYANDIDNDITNITLTPKNNDKFVVNHVRRASHKNISLG